MDNLDKQIKVFSIAREPSVETQPYFEETRNRGGWINFGSDNLAPIKIMEWLNKSSRHNSIVKDKAMMIGSSGWDKTGLSVKALNFIENVNSKYDMTLDDILAKISLDFEIYGAFALNPIWDKGRNTITIEYLDPSKVRYESPEFGECSYESENFYISHNWAKIREFKPIIYPKFSEEDRTFPSQILYIKDHRNNSYYGEPEYSSGMNWLELDYAISRFHNQCVKQGFAPSMIINFATGIPSDEEMRSMILRLRQEYENVENAGKVIFTFSDGKDGAPTITPIQLNDSDKKYIMLNEEVQKGILAAHRIKNPILFGIETPGKLGGRNEMLESLAIFQSTYIDPKQKFIERVFNKLARINGVQDELKIKKYQIDFSKITSGVTDILSVLESTISPEQKYHLLIYNGLDKEKSKQLSGYDPAQPEENITPN